MTTMKSWVQSPAQKARNDRKAKKDKKWKARRYPQTEEERQASMARTRAKLDAGSDFCIVVVAPQAKRDPLFARDLADEE